MPLKKNIYYHSISRISFLGSALLINILFSHILNASGTGQLYYTINNLSILTLILSLSLESSITYFLSKGKLQDPELVSFSLIWSMLAAGIGTSIIIIFKNGIISSPRYDSPAYTVLFIFGSLLTTYVSGLFFAKREFFVPHIIPAFNNILVAICLAWVFFMDKSLYYLKTVTTIFFLSYTLNGLLLTYYYLKKYKVSAVLIMPQKNTIIKISGYSGLAFIANIVAFLAYRIDYWILKLYSPRYISENALGNYIQVARLVQLFLFAPTIIATIVFPVSASIDKPYFRNHLKKIILKSLLLNSAACVLVILSGKWLFDFLFGSSFSLMYKCFLFSIPAILSITIVRIIASYFAGINKVIYNLIGGLTALVIIIILNIVFIPVMGINGSALADSLGYICYMSLLIYLFYNKAVK